MYESVVLSDVFTGWVQSAERNIWTWREEIRDSEENWVFMKMLK
jgi:hypothetical protein